MVQEWDPEYVCAHESERWRKLLTELREDLEHAYMIATIEPDIGSEHEREVWRELRDGGELSWADLSELAPTLQHVYDEIGSRRRDSPTAQSEISWERDYLPMIRMHVGSGRREHPAYNPFVIRERILECRQAFDVAVAVLREQLQIHVGRAASVSDD